MKKEFTPGEWKQSHRQIPNDPDGMYSTQVYTEDGETIASLAWYPKPPVSQIIDGESRIVTGSYREANAKLIVVAPELLEFAIEMAERYQNSPWIYEQANALIKKATL